MDTNFPNSCQPNHRSRSTTTLTKLITVKCNLSLVSIQHRYDHQLALPTPLVTTTSPTRGAVSSPGKALYKEVACISSLTTDVSLTTPTRKAAITLFKGGSYEKGVFFPLYTPILPAGRVAWFYSRCCWPSTRRSSLSVVFRSSEDVTLSVVVHLFHPGLFKYNTLLSILLFRERATLSVFQTSCFTGLVDTNKPPRQYTIDSFPFTGRIYYFDHADSSRQVVRICFSPFY